MAASSVAEPELIIAPSTGFGRLHESTLFIIAHGTEQEVEPYVLLAWHLSSVCQRVLLALPRHLKLRWKTKLPAVALFDLNGNLDEEISRVGELAGDQASLFRELSNYMLRHLRSNYQIAWDVCAMEHPTALLCAANCIPESLAIGQRLQIPTYILPTYPLSPSAELPPVLACAQPFRSGVVNRLVHWMAASATWKVFGDVINDFRSALGLPLEDEASFEGIPQLCLFHPAVQPSPADWPTSVAPFGIVPLPDALATAEQRGLGHSLTRFLATPAVDGKHLVYCDLAPLPSPLVARLFAWLVVAAAALDCVCVFHLPAGQDTALHIPEDAGVAAHHYFLVPSPQPGLLPRCSAVVHTGSPGLLSRALAAGVPHLVVPAYGDQLFWAWRLGEFGVAPPQPPNAFQLTGAEQLRGQLAFVLQADVRARCRDIAASPQPVDTLFQWLEERLATDENRAGIVLRWSSKTDRCSTCSFTFRFWSSIMHCHSCGRIFCTDCVSQAHLPSQPGGPHSVCADCVQRRQLRTL